MCRELSHAAPSFSKVGAPFPESPKDAVAARVLDRSEGHFAGDGGEGHLADTGSGDLPAEPSELNTLAARVIMTVMYAARVARRDLLRAIAYLARDLTTWSEDTDARLHRLAPYLQSTLAFRVYAWHDPSSVEQPWALRVSSDADYAGRAETKRHTMGAIVFLSGKGTLVPLSLLPKRQGCVSISTPEADLVAMDTALRTLTLPAPPPSPLMLLEEVFGVQQIEIDGDNRGMTCVLKTGRSPTMRHWARTHSVSVSWSHEQCQREKFAFRYVPHQWQGVGHLHEIVSCPQQVR